MELQVLRSILHKELRPWRMEEEKKNQLIEALMLAENKNAGTLAELAVKAKLLVSAFPELSKCICLRLYKEDRPLDALPYQCELPAITNGFSKCYQVLIDCECLRIYNKFLDFRGHESIGARAANIVLKKTRVLAYEVSEKIKKIKRNGAYSDTDRFVLEYLKLQLRNLYFSIQRLFVKHLPLIVDWENFQLLVLREDADDIVGLATTSAIEKGKALMKENSKAQSDAPVSFNCKGDREKIKKVIIQLCKKVKLLHESSRWEDLVEVLFAPSVTPGSKTIRLEWYNTEFRFLIKRLQPYFESLLFVNIERSGIFQDRDGKLLKATAFYQAGKSTTSIRNSDVVKEILKDLY